MCHLPQRRFSKKVKKMFKLFKKGGLNGSKNVNFEEKKFRFEMGLKKHIQYVPQGPKESFFKKSRF